MKQAADATHQPTVLVVEDEPKLARVIQEYLENFGGFRTHHFARGEPVVAWVRAQQPDLIILDVMLPGGDGMTLCQTIRQFSQVPIIMATARVEEIDRLLGLELGADDYLCKPFSPRELVARVKALLRRAAYHNGNDIAANGTHRFELDPARYLASLNGQALKLTRVEFSLLHSLHTHPGRVFSRQQLMDRIYSDYRVVSDRTVDTHIKNLRRKLAAVVSGHEFIESVYGVGYRLAL